MGISIEQLREGLTALNERVDSQLAQTEALVEAVNALIAKIPPSPDYQAELDAVVGMINKLDQDDATVQAAIDAAAGQP